MVKNLFVMQETWVWSLGQEDSLEKGIGTYSSIPAWRISWSEDPGGLWSMGSQRVRHNWVTNTHTHPYPIVQWLITSLTLNLLMSYSLHIKHSSFYTIRILNISQGLNQVPVPTWKLSWWIWVVTGNLAKVWHCDTCKSKTVIQIPVSLLVCHTIKLIQ